jgi:hypothetical protein
VNLGVVLPLLAFLRADGAREAAHVVRDVDATISSA